VAKKIIPSRGKANENPEREVGAVGGGAKERRMGGRRREEGELSPTPRY